MVLVWDFLDKAYTGWTLATGQIVPIPFSRVCINSLTYFMKASQAVQARLSYLLDHWFKFECLLLSS